jgi:recombination protein RecT
LIKKRRIMANELVQQTKVEEIALAKIQEYQDAGMVLPLGFNPANSLKKARFILNDMKVNGKPVLEVCSQASIIQCLLESVTKGLSYDESQIYFIPRGGVMTNMESVYGRILRAKRASKNYKPIVGYVHEGDDFEIGHDLETGATIIKKHETKLENLDKPIIAAYAYVTDNDGNTDVTIMTKREWLTSWKKSPTGCAVAKEFEKDMIFRTIVKKSTKPLVNSNNNFFVSNSSDDDDEPLAGSMPVDYKVGSSSKQYEDFQEAEEVDTATGEIVASDLNTDEDF